MKRWRTSQAGFTLIEVLTSLVVFGLISAAIYSAYYAQVKQTTRQYSLAKASMDIQIIKNLIESDITMAGFGLAEGFVGHPNAAGLATNTSAIKAVNGGTNDEMTLMGTALGIESRFSQGWTVVKTDAFGLLAPVVWTDDPRDSLQDDTRYVVMDPYGRKLSDPWVGEYDSSNPTTTLPQGTLLYALYDKSAGAASVTTDAGEPGLMPHYEVKYSRGGAALASCADGTESLLRSETRTTTAVAGSPLLNCVLNMQVAFGLDQDDDEIIDLWDNGGGTAALLSRDDLNKQLQQVRVYVLSQASERDDNYQSPSPIRVVEADLGTGADVTLDLVQKQEKYRWNLLTMVVTPRNMRSPPVPRLARGHPMDD